jgi:integrase
MTIAYCVMLEPDDNDTLFVTCRSLPEITTFGDDEADALCRARDAIEEAIADRAFKNIGLKGYSSHSGRRTFVTRAARAAHRAGGSLRDVQLLAGHRSIQTTQRYIDGDSDAQRKLVGMV